MLNQFIKTLYVMLLIQLAACQSTEELQIGVQVAPGIYGFNTGSSFYHCKPVSMAPCQENLRELKPNLLRFPGGVDANYYHLDGAGYGFRVDLSKNNPSDISKSRGARQVSEDDSSERRGREIGSKDPRDAKHYPDGKNVIGAFIEAVVPDKIPVMFTLNLWDASYSENKRVIDSLLRGGVKMVAFELGNEFYLRRYSSIYPDVAAYLDSARHYAARLRQDFPGVPIGAIAAPAEVKGIKSGMLSHYRAWNEAMAKESFFDALTMHHYGKNTTCSCLDEQEIPEAQRREAFLCTLESGKKELDDWFGSGLKNTLNTFPGKKIWLTEWNATNLFHCFGNTQVYNLYFARYLNELASQYSDRVEYTAHHNWVGGGVHYPTATWNDKQQRFNKKSSSLLFESLQPLFSRPTFNMTLPAEVVASNQSNLSIYAYYQAENGSDAAELLVCAINMGDQTQTITWPETWKVRVEGVEREIKQGRHHCMYATDLAASLGAPGFADQKVADIFTEQKAVKQRATLPGYSVSLIHLIL